MAKYSNTHYIISEKPNIYFYKGKLVHLTHIQSSISDYEAAVAFCVKLNNAAQKRGLKA